MPEQEFATFIKSSDMLGKTPADILKLQTEVSAQWQKSNYRDSNDVWWADGIPIEAGDTYDATFMPILEKLGYKSISDMLEHRRKSGYKNNVLDVMGGCYFLENPQLADSLTGFRMGNVDVELEEKYENETFPGDTRLQKLKVLLDMTDMGLRHIVTGDVFDLKSWDIVKRRGQEIKHGNGFDMVFIRPEGPFLRTMSAVGKDAEVVKVDTNVRNMYRALYFNIFSNAVAMMAPEQSVLFAQFPRVLSDDMDLFKERANGISGLSCETHSGMRKTSGDNNIPNFVVSLTKN